MTHTVLIKTYSLEAGRVGADHETIWSHDHPRSAAAAARTLAGLIAGRTPWARRTLKGLKARGRMFLIRGADGVERSLCDHRKHYGVRP